MTNDALPPPVASEAADSNPGDGPRHIGLNRAGGGGSSERAVPMADTTNSNNDKPDPLHHNLRSTTTTTVSTIRSNDSAGDLSVLSGHSAISLTNAAKTRSRSAGSRASCIDDGHDSVSGGSNTGDTTTSSPGGRMTPQQLPSHRQEQAPPPDAALQVPPSPPSMLQNPVGGRGKHNRKRTWSAPAGAVELVMAEAAAEANVPSQNGPSFHGNTGTTTTRPNPAPVLPATAHNTPQKYRDEQAYGFQSNAYYGDLVNDSFSESYDDFDEGGNTSNGVGSLRRLGKMDDEEPPPQSDLDKISEADRGGGHVHPGNEEEQEDDEEGGGRDSLTTPSPSIRRTARARARALSTGSPSVSRILSGLGDKLSRSSPRGRHQAVELSSPQRESRFINDDDGVNPLAIPSLGFVSDRNISYGNDNDNASARADASAIATADHLTAGRPASRRPLPVRDSRGRLRRSISARSLINLGRLGGVEAVLNDRTESQTSTEPLNVDLRQIASEAIDADDDMIADVAQTSAARQAADGHSSPEQESLVKELIYYFRHRPWKKKVLMLTVIASVIWVCIDFATTGYIRSFLSMFVDWMQNNAAGGFFVFIALFIVTTLVFIPPSILTLGSGVAFAKAFGLGPGILLASAASFFGACVGAVIAFFRARYLMRDLIKLFARRYPIVNAVDRAMKEKGFRIYLLLRMCPIIPFNAINYIGGITGVKWNAYTFALIGILPWQIVLVFIGATVGSVNDMNEGDQDSYNKVSLTIGCVLSVVTLIIMWYYARKELKKEIAAHQEVEQGVGQSNEDIESQSNRSSSVRTDATGLDRLSFASIQGFGDFEESPEDVDRSVAEGEDEAWYWIWT